MEQNFEYETLKLDDDDETAISISIHFPHFLCISISKLHVYILILNFLQPILMKIFCMMNPEIYIVRKARTSILREKYI